LFPPVTLGVISPSRILLPEFFGVTCVSEQICIDDQARLDEAHALLTSAQTSLREKWGMDSSPDKIIFCSKIECARRFGLNKAAGITFGQLGIVIAPRGWTHYYVTHELIHDWQSDRYGSLALRLADQWIIEGMAYALSEDPRSVLAEPFETYRSKFSQWQTEQSETSVIDALDVLLN